MLQLHQIRFLLTALRKCTITAACTVARCCKHVLAFACRGDRHTIDHNFWALAKAGLQRETTHCINIQDFGILWNCFYPLPSIYFHLLNFNSMFAHGSSLHSAKLASLWLPFQEWEGLNMNKFALLPQWIDCGNIAVLQRDYQFRTGQVRYTQVAFTYLSHQSLFQSLLFIPEAKAWKWCEHVWTRHAPITMSEKRTPVAHAFDATWQWKTS